ncbi:MAG: non-homologous end-joining DNA ligase, partial [Ilyomonas sp.]
MAIKTSEQKQTVKKKREKIPSFPSDIKPMLATLADKPFDEEGWLYEVKWDGYRAVGYINNCEVNVCSRNNKSFNDKFYPVYEALKKWKINAIVDGEIIVVNEKGISDFEDLQSWRSEADGPLAFYLFDILWLNGENLMQKPLNERKEILRSVIPSENNIIRLSENFDSTGTEFFQLAEKMGLEGIMAKKKDSLYIPDTRSKDWLKIKTEKRHEAVIGGYTRNENTTKKFSALLLGAYEHGVLKFTGPVGTGFSNQIQNELIEKMNELKTAICPFDTTPEYNKPSRFRPDPPKAEVTWLQPKLVAEISYRSGSRHPSFKGLREDKEAKDVVIEKPVATETILQEEKDSSSKKLFKPGTTERKTLLNPKEVTQVRNIDGHELKFTNLTKVFWPKEKVTKRDMLNYYYQVAPYMLPYMKDRPQTLNRFPHGIEGESFYQKNVTGKVPGWIKTFPYHSERGGDRNFLVCTNEASIMYIASLGCIEMNSWSSRTEKADNPDWCIIDL